jgi:hypothetical protein
MLLQTLGKFLAFGVGGGALGVVAAAVTGYALQNYLGEEMLPLLWLIGGLGGMVVGASQVSWRRRRRRRRRRPQVVLPPMKPASGDIPGASSSVSSASAGGQPELVPGEPASLFQQATGATTAELANVRVCDVRLDGDGEPLGVRLSQNGQEREVFLVHDHHRDIVAEALDAALRREPGNRRARLFP